MAMEPIGITLFHHRKGLDVSYWTSTPSAGTITYFWIEHQEIKVEF